jgi:hypothetical protein
VTAAENLAEVALFVLKEESMLELTIGLLLLAVAVYFVSRK